MQEISYRGGLARFRLPDHWMVEIDPDAGGCFYDPDSPGTLRLNVLTFVGPPKGRPVLPRSLKAGQRLIGRGQLTSGSVFDVYEVDAIQDAEPIRTRFWKIFEVRSGEVNVFLFSYAYPIGSEKDIRDELALVDQEIRRVTTFVDG